MSQETRRVPISEGIARSYKMLAQAYLDQDKELRGGYEPLGEMAPGRVAFQEAVRERVENGERVSGPELALHLKSGDELF